MMLRSIGCGGVLLVALLSSWNGPAAQPAIGSTAPAAGAAVPAAVTAEYRRKLAAYALAREQYETAAAGYWSAIAEKRALRNAKRRSNNAIVLDDYVLTQPPVYRGPPKPVDPSAPAEQPAPPVREYVPVVADFLGAAAEHFNFVPQAPASEIEFKRAYARLAAAAGLTREQVVRVYGFECGGNGKYDVQAGLEQLRPGARAISPALGYNQLLNTNSVSLLAEKGEQFIRALQTKAATQSGAARTALERKIAIVRRMIEFSRSVPGTWREQDRLANTPRGLAVHALNLDIDVGPMLQVQKLLDSVVFARRKGLTRTLSAAELEMMNLTGDGNGLDMIGMPIAIRDQVPTANFFQRRGYERNAVARRNNVVAKLLAATDAQMDKEVKLRGAQELAAAFPQ